MKFITKSLETQVFQDQSFNSGLRATGKTESIISAISLCKNVYPLDMPALQVTG